MKRQEVFMIFVFVRCTGNGAECPPSPPLPDGTPCIEKGTCYQGKCLPFCESQKPSLQSCMCDVLENACKRCCRTHLNDTCFPVDPLDILPNGTPCMVGYCKDVSFLIVWLNVYLPYQPVPLLFTRRKRHVLKMFGCSPF